MKPSCLFHGRAGASGAEEARQGAGRLEAGWRQRQEAAALKAELPSRGELHDGGSRGALALGVASEQTLGVARQTNTLNQLLYLLGEHTIPRRRRLRFKGD